MILLLKAADVFESLANPLMKLVGLKTVEMAEEGKINTVVFDFTHFYSDVLFHPILLLCYLLVFDQFLKFYLCLLIIVKLNSYAYLMSQFFVYFP